MIARPHPKHHHAHHSVAPHPDNTNLSLGIALGVAKKAGATILFLTAQTEGRGAAWADYVLKIPAQTMADDLGDKKTSVLPMGSLFEGALYVLFEVMVLKLKEKLKISPDSMRANHTNLE